MVWCGAWRGSDDGGSAWRRGVWGRTEPFALGAGGGVSSTWRDRCLGGRRLCEDSSRASYKPSLLEPFPPALFTVAMVTNLLFSRFRLPSRWRNQGLLPANVHVSQDKLNEGTQQELGLRFFFA